MKISMAILAYNRPDHLERVVRATVEQGIRAFTVYIDGAPNTAVAQNQEKIVSFLESVNQADITIIRRQKNHGLAYSITTAVTSELERNEAVIVLEDDCVPRSGFFTFMTEALTRYRDHPSVRSVCGYQFPFAIDDSNIISLRAIRRFTPWGWATWRNRWTDYSKDFKTVADTVERYGMRHRLTQDLRVYCNDQAFLSGTQDIWSLSWVIAHYMTDTLCVYPTYPLVENIGFDGSGVHCIETSDFDIPDQLDAVKVDLPDDVQLDFGFDCQVERFLDANSVKTMLKEADAEDDQDVWTDAIQPFSMRRFGSHSLAIEDIKGLVEVAVEGSPILDMHTHLFPPQHKGFYLQGLEACFNYHYLVAEVLTVTKRAPAEFYSLSSPERARFVWDELFVKRSPMSEACQGVLTLLSRFHISGLGMSFDQISEKADRVIYQDSALFESSGVESVVMTNDPFNAEEWALFDRDDWDRKRYLASMRLDVMFNDPVKAAEMAREVGAKGSNDMACLLDHLETCYAASKPVYSAISLDGLALETLIKSDLWLGVLDWLKEKDMPLALMLGVTRAVNPHFGLAGDGLGAIDLKALSALCRTRSDNRFLVTVLSATDQHAISVLGRKHQNLTLFGFWWFVNQPSLIESFLEMRFDLLGENFVPQHSDARVTDQLIYKWDHFRALLAKVLTRRYQSLALRGWHVTPQIISRDVIRLLYSRPAEALGLDLEPRIVA